MNTVRRATLVTRPLDSSVDRTVRRIMSGLPTAVVWTIAIVWTVPSAGFLVGSLRTSDTARFSGWWNSLLRPGELSFDAYRDVLSYNATTEYLDAVANSFAIAVPATVIPLLAAAAAAYAIAWIPFRGREWVFLATVAMLAVPFQATLIPLLQLFSGGASWTVPVLGTTVTLFPDLDLAGTIPAVWLTHIGFGLPFGIFLIYAAMIRIPRDFIDLSFVEGGDHRTTLRQVAIPMTLPAIASFGILQFLFTWNDFLIALTMIGGVNPDALPVTVKLATIGGWVDAWEPPITMAGAVLHAAVPIALFVVLSRYVLSGFLAAVSLTGAD